MITANSRYAAEPQDTVTDPDGTTRAYVVPPLLPPAAAWRDTVGYRVTDSDRLDLLAERVYDNPEAWVLIAGATPVADPDQVLDTPGREIAVPRAGAMPDPLIGPDGTKATG